MMKSSNVISIFRPRRPAWQAPSERATLAEPGLTLADQLRAVHQPEDTPPPAMVLTRPDPGEENPGPRPGGPSRHRLRLARELLRSVNEPDPDMRGRSHREESGEVDVLP